MKLHYASNSRSLLGTIHYNDPTEPEAGYSPSPVWDSEPAFESASTKLHEARAALGSEYRSPCQQNPRLWDTREEREKGSGQGRPRKQGTAAPLSQYAERVKLAVRLCGACQVLGQCRDVLRTINLSKPIARGVIAGYLVDPEPAGDLTRKALNMTSGGQQ